MNKLIINSIIILTLNLITFSLIGQDLAPYRGIYLGQPLPGITPQVFAQKIISTEEFEHATPTFYGLNEFYFSRVVGPPWRFENTHYIMDTDSVWHVDTLSLEKKYKTTEYYPSRNGNRLYFTSLRPVNPQKDSISKIWNIWYVDRNVDRWSEPKFLPPPIQSDYHDGQFFEASDNSCYFTSWRNQKQPDLFKAVLKNGHYEIDSLFGKNINTSYDDKEPFISDRGDILLFKSNRPGGMGKNDIYVAFKNSLNEWSAPINLGETINSDSDEWYPRLSPDGKYLFYLSDRSGSMDVYWVESSILKSLNTNLIVK